MNEILNDLSQLFFISVSSFYTDLSAEITTSLILLLLLVVIIIIIREVKNLFSTDFESSRYKKLVTDIIFPLAYVLIVRYADLYLEGQISLILFASVSYLYLGYSIVLISFTDPEQKMLMKAVSAVLVVLAVISLFTIQLNAQLFGSEAIEISFELILKISLIIASYLLLYANYRQLTRLLPGKYISDTFRKFLLRALTLFYFLISVLWLIDVIDIGFEVLIAFVLSVIAVSVYALVMFYIRRYINIRLSLQPDSYPLLMENITALLSLTLFLIIYGIFLDYLNLSVVVDYLREKDLLDTDIIHISLYKLFASVFLLVYLFALTNVCKHAVYYLYIIRGKRFEAESTRQLVFNLGALFSVIIFISKLGFSWKALLPIAGALGIGVGIGLQNIMNNYISGFILLFSRMLKVGDIVELEGSAGKAAGTSIDTIYGRVLSINLLSTLVRTTDGIEVIVPNSDFIQQKVVNYSLSDQFIRLRIPFGVSYESDPETIRDILLSMAEESSLVMDEPKPEVRFAEMADSAIIFNLMIWIDIRQLWRIGPIVSDFYYKGWYRLKKAGVVIPFPQRDVWFRNRMQVEISEEAAKKTDTNDDGKVKE